MVAVTVDGGGRSAHGGGALAGCGSREVGIGGAAVDDGILAAIVSSLADCFYRLPLSRFLDLRFLSNFFRSSSSNNASLAQQPSHPRPDFHPGTATGRRTSTAARPPRFANAPPPSFATAHIRFASAAPPSHRRHAQPPQPCPATTAPPSQRRSAQLPPCPATAGFHLYSSKFMQRTLIVWGDQDQIFPLELGYRLQRHIGEEADLVVIKNAGHAVNLEKTNEFAKHLKAFLYESLSD
nr:monoacylglycerol lipase ABHD6 [Ipomoea batatas]